MARIDSYKIGVDNELLRLESFDENRILASHLVQQATRSVDIASRLLDPPVFNSSEFIEAVRYFVTKNRMPKIRIIVHDPATIVKLGHRLVDLAGNLSSLIEIRKAGHEHKYYSECLLVADDTAFLHRLNGERCEATANYNNRRQSRYYLEDFNKMWDASVTDPNLRRMSL